MAAIMENLDVVIPLADRPIRIKFGTSVQNHMPMTTKSSKSKPEVEFPYDVRLFSKSGSIVVSKLWIEIEKQQIYM